MSKTADGRKHRKTEKVARPLYANRVRGELKDETRGLGTGKRLLPMKKHQHNIRHRA